MNWPTMTQKIYALSTAEAGLETQLGGNWHLQKVTLPALYMLIWTYTLQLRQTNMAGIPYPLNKHG
jgi:hypothetical protein